MCLLAIDNHWKKAKNDKFVFDKVTKKPNDKHVFELLETVIFFIQKKCFNSFFLANIHFFVKVVSERTHAPKLQLLNTLGGEGVSF